MSASVGGHCVQDIPGIAALRARTRGSERICVAILDGAVDFFDGVFAGSRLARLPAVRADMGGEMSHGTRIAGLILSERWGLAPGCRGIIVPIFARDNDACSQRRLAHAILDAAGAGAQVINISSGAFSISESPDQLLADAVQGCEKQRILVVAAAGNDGGRCAHLPGALPSVLVVGAMAADGQPLPLSNFADSYRAHGILALGQDVLGPRVGGGSSAASGTSEATAVVSGVAALLLSLQVALAQTPDPLFVRKVLLDSAVPHEAAAAADARRCLSGRLDVAAAARLLEKGRQS